MTLPELIIDRPGNRQVIRLTGRLVTEALGAMERAFAAVPRTAEPVDIDMSRLDAIDTGGAWMVADLKKELAQAGATVTLRGAKPAHLALLKTVEQGLPEEEGIEAPPTGFVPWLAGLGESVAGGWKGVVSFLGFFGLMVSRLAGTVVRPWRLRGTSLVSQIEDAGFNAIPIVTLMGFLIGIVLGFQGAAQLRQFGAEVFVVDLISISILRELGILLTAIIVAGRSGSAFTASIGSMNVQEEIDAMRALGLDPIEVLVLPRVLALVIVLPILGMIANIAGIVGGLLMSWIELGISPGMFLTRLHDGTDVSHLLVGLIKAPFFALMIGSVACWQAMQVQGSAESIGKRTTVSVVQSILLAIIIDAVFSIFFSEIGV